MKTIYLDHAAATPVDDRVIAAMSPHWNQSFHNPSAVYLAGRAARKRLDEYRAGIAYWLGARAEEIIFTSGATESNNLALVGVMKQFPDASIAVSAVEHDAVLKTAEQYSRRVIAVDKFGSISKKALKAAITDKTALVSIVYADNETGSIQALSDFANVIEEIRDYRKKSDNQLPLYFHTDATQAANYLDLHVNRLKVDLMTLSAGKIYGPKQVGALYVRGGTKLSPLFGGGGQQRGLRSGTESLANAAGLQAALELVQSSRQEEEKRLSVMKKQMESELKRNIDDIEILGGSKRLPNITCMLLPGLDGERAVMELDERGIQCSTGSACAALRDESSHVIKAMGYSEAQASATLRLSLGRDTTKQACDEAVKTIVELYGKTRHN